MSKTVKFTVSMPAAGFKELESRRRKTGRTRSQFIRDAIRAWIGETVRPSGVKEKAGEYKKEASIDLTNLEERRQRAVAAAGRFRSGISDLSSKHDKYLEGAYSAIAPVKDEGKAR
jgi:metal-responsive CopG/Arc/MetJ family transcriptional regulator